MTIDITGIRNENEFFTHHYLSAILEQDIKGLISKWEDPARKDLLNPVDELVRLRKPLLKLSLELETGSLQQERVKLMREFHRNLCEILGYPCCLELRESDDKKQLPILGELNRQDGSPVLWVLEAFPEHGQEKDDPLSLTMMTEQINLPEAGPMGEASVELPENETWEEIITRRVFGRNEPPRWVILLSAGSLLLIDRTKWNEKRSLRFNLLEILGRQVSSTIKAVAALLHREAVCPDDGFCLIDTLSDNSHKHAFAVSEDLKFALRQAIELLGNEAIRSMREDQRVKVYDRNLAESLTRECLRFMYRLLFLFYVEARPELGFSAMKSEIYRLGYSLESLRDLELMPLTTDEARNGTYLHKSIKLLFKMMFDGYNMKKKQMVIESIMSDTNDQEIGTDRGQFRIAPLQSHLFDPDSTPTLNSIKIRNIVMQKIIELLSLSRPGDNNRTRRGRISYSQLGINQLGAVYEALLSFSGFFAETDLYEVKKATGNKKAVSIDDDDEDIEDDESSENADGIDDSADEDIDSVEEPSIGQNMATPGVNELDPVFLVPKERLAEYSEKEKVYLADGTQRMYPRGSFIYRLAGRNREKSASFYTPEVLTRCLVKYALKELLADKCADEILDLLVCEPAMGSAAFLNEVIDQLAEAYLSRKQRELGRGIAHADYATEKQKVKMYLADNNVFGVDLNPVAVELGEVSLWLNTIFDVGKTGQKPFIPWFGMQLTCGNSLIGARRQVFHSESLGKKVAKAERWLNLVPDAIAWQNANGRLPVREKKTIYHFLLPDAEMAGYKDKVVKDLAKANIEQIEKWRAKFSEPFTDTEIVRLEALSDAVDRLWAAHIKTMISLRKKTTDPLPIFGKNSQEQSASSTRDKDALFFKDLLSKEQSDSSAYRRLKLVMDYWCALWFWPILEADLLPSRDEFLFEITAILEGEVTAREPEPGTQLSLPGLKKPVAEQATLDFRDNLGRVNVDYLCERLPRLAMVRKLAEKFRFLHWELEYADIFAQRGGFDLIVGNPPWIKVEWKEGGLLGEAEPIFAIRKLSAKKLTEKRRETIDKHNLLPAYLSEYEEASATQKFLNALQNYPELAGMKSNLYKCFLPQAWRIGTCSGISAFVHPEGIYDDPNGGVFREKVYPRLCYHFQFVNEHQLFGDVHHCTQYSVNVYSEKKKHAFLSFASISNLFIPATIDQCFEHSGLGPVPGIKDENHKWNTNGHRERVIEVGMSELTLFAKLYDSEGTPPGQARLPAVHAKPLLEVLKKIASQPQRLGDFEGEFFLTQHWNEVNAQKDGTIRRETRFAENPSEWVLSGPHFFVGNPFNKTPRAVCTANGHYDVIDLTNIPPDYLPRTNYVPACSPEEYLRRTPKVPWGSQQPVTDFYRLIFRRRLGQSGERTLVPAIIPALPGHINQTISLVFKANLELATFFALCCSLIGDFYIKTTGRPDLYEAILRMMPVIQPDHQVIVRALRLCCVNKYYRNLWGACFDKAWNYAEWTKADPRLDSNNFKVLNKEFEQEVLLKADFERRQALLELDVLIAKEFGLSIDELIMIYRAQFPITRQYEADTWYDRNGRIVFTASKGLPGVGLDRKQWQSENSIKKLEKAGIRILDLAPDEFKTIKEMPHGRVERDVIDDTLPGGPRRRTITYVAPFDRCDREEDYRIAWKVFSERSQNKKGD